MKLSSCNSLQFTAVVVVIVHCNAKNSDRPINQNECIEMHVKSLEDLGLHCTPDGFGEYFFCFQADLKKFGGYVSPILENNVLIFGVLGGDGGCTIRCQSVLGYKITPRKWMKVKKITT